MEGRKGRETGKKRGVEDGDRKHRFEVGGVNAADPNLRGQVGGGRQDGGGHGRDHVQEEADVGAASSAVVRHHEERKRLVVSIRSLTEVAVVVLLNGGVEMAKWQTQTKTGRNIPRSKGSGRKEYRQIAGCGDRVGTRENPTQATR